MDVIRQLLKPGLFVLIILANTSLSAYAQNIKVVSFNIRYDNEEDGVNKWSYRKPHIFNFIAYENPDFIGVQEALINQIRELDSALTSYEWIGVSRDDGIESGEFTPVFFDSERWELIETSTIWLSETPFKPSKSWDAALPRICTWGRFRHRVTGKGLDVFNTHFDHVGEIARKKSADLIVEWIESKNNYSNVVLTGDFNSEPGTAVIDKIINSPLSDAFIDSPIRYGPIGTFNEFDPRRNPERRIDFVFRSEDLIVKKYGVDSRLIDGKFLSDHFPVIVVLSSR